jgi:hypothetical protein
MRTGLRTKTFAELDLLEMDAELTRSNTDFL